MATPGWARFSSMGWLSAGAMIALFMPTECYRGWLQDDSFGGSRAEGVNRRANHTPAGATAV